MRRQVAVFHHVPRRKQIILNHTKEEGNIIYGARSIQAHLGLISRETNDYDVLSKKPKHSAKSVEKRLDKSIGFNYYYTKPAEHKGTYKVRGLGYDMKKGTDDDESIADYTKLSKPIPKTVSYNGVKYRVLNQEIQAKKNSLADKSYAFRHEKDKRDLRIIETNLNAGKMLRPKIAWGK